MRCDTFIYTYMESVKNDQIFTGKKYKVKIP